jgi:hypothetical protein
VGKENERERRGRRERGAMPGPGQADNPQLALAYL